MREDTNEVKGVLTETGHFGLRDLLYGEPSFNDVRTLSYCYILVIDAASFNLVFDGDDDLQEVLQENRAKLEERIRALNFVYQSAGREWEKKERKPTGIPSWITFPTKENPENELCSYEEFTNAYKKSWFGQLCRSVCCAAKAWVRFDCVAFENFVIFPGTCSCDALYTPPGHLPLSGFSCWPLAPFWTCSFSCLNCFHSS